LIIFAASLSVDGKSDAVAALHNPQNLRLLSRISIATCSYGIAAIASFWLLQCLFLQAALGCICAIPAEKRKAKPRRSG
jgi:hypothetical protein